MGRILIIEDDLDLASAYEQTLIGAGFKTLKVTDGRDAIAKIRNEKFDLIVTDLQIPRASGVEILKSLRRFESDSLTKTPVIVASGTLDEESTLRMQALDRVSLLIKPIDSQNLISKVRDVLAVPEKKSLINKESLQQVVSSLVSCLTLLSDSEVAVVNLGLKKPNECSGDISTVMAVQSQNFMGQISISFYATSFLRLVSKMARVEMTTLDQKSCEAMTEVLQLMQNSVRRGLSQDGAIEILVRTPAIMTGKNHRIENRGPGPAVVVLLKGRGFGECRIEISNLSNN